MISCLMVTQSGRQTLAGLAMADFAAQCYPNRELVVVHDGDSECHAALHSAAATHSVATIRVRRTEPGQTLGELRNAAVEAAAGDFVCQWDDDDRYHPERLTLQWNALRDAGAEFCFLRDQLHWYPLSGELYWEDWDSEAYPLNLVQGTLLGRRDCMPAYPARVRGEDTGLLLTLLRGSRRITRLAGAGWCSVYVYHGANAWSEAHHRAISAAKSLGEVRLLQRWAGLQRRLAEYRPGLGPLHMPHPSGALTLE